MKILHSSDWHIGRKLYNKELKNDMALFFDWILETINSEKIDVLIIAGDIFDLAYPSNESLKIYYNFLTQLNNSFCSTVVITGGNHDSKSTLEAPKDILQMMNIVVVGGTRENIEEQIIEVKKNGKTELVVCAVPYLRDSDIRSSISGESYENRHQKIREGIANYFAKMAEKIKHYKAENIPVIATGHLFVSDSKSYSEGERELYVGGLQEMTIANFPQEFDYIALGHIHRSQNVSDKILYSGTPIPMSFSERNQQKSVVILEKNDSGFEIEKLAVPKFRNMVLFKGEFLKVKKLMENYEDDGQQKAWAEIEIVEEKYNPDLQSVAEKFISEIENIEIINYKIIFTDKIGTVNQLIESTESLKDISETKIFERLLAKTAVENPDELKSTFLELIENIE